MRLLLSCCILTVLLISVIFAGCASTTQPSETTPSPSAKIAEIPIAMLVDLSGPYSTQCLPMSEGFIDAIAWANEKQYISGVKLVNSMEDDKGSPEATIPAYKRLSTANPKPAMMNVVETPCILTVKNSVNSDAIPTLCAGVHASLFWPPEYIFSTYTLYENQCAAWVDYFLANKWKGPGKPKFAVLTWDNAVGRAWMTSGEAQKYIKSKGIETVAEIYIPSTPTDVTSEILSLKNSGADFTFGALHGAIFAMVLKAAEAQGLTGITYGMFSGCDMNIPAQKAPNAGEGATAIGINRNSIAEFEKYTPELMQVAKKNNRSELTLISGYALGWYMASINCEAIKRAVEKVGVEKISNDAVFQSLQTFDNWDPWNTAVPVTYTGGQRQAPNTCWPNEIIGGKVVVQPPIPLPNLLVKK